MENVECGLRSQFNADCGMQNAEYKSFTPHSTLRIPNLEYSEIYIPKSEINYLVISANQLR